MAGGSLSDTVADSRPRPLGAQGTGIVLQVGLIVFTLGFVAIGRGIVVQAFFAPLCLVIAWMFWLHRPAQYIGFVAWLWMLAPLVRRLVDWQIGPSVLSPVLLAPVLCSAISFITVLSVSRHLKEARYLPFFAALLVVMFGYFIGILFVGPFPATFAMLNWLGPLSLAIYIVAHRTRASEITRYLFTTLTAAGLILGLYGLVQYFAPPAWDVAWMSTADMNSIGRPVAGQIRLFSTMNSPVPFAMYMVAALLVMAGTRSFLRWFAALPAAAGLLLSLVRAAWGGFVIGLLMLFMMLPGRHKLRYILAVLAVIAFAVPVLPLLPFADTVMARLDTVASLEADRSFHVRLTFFFHQLDASVTMPFGRGLGEIGLASRLASSSGDLGTYGLFDNGILEVVSTFGWPAFILYAALIALLLRAWRASRSSPEAAVAFSIALATAVQLPFVNVLFGNAGVLVWPFLALALSLERRGEPAKVATGA